MTPSGPLAPEALADAAYALGLWTGWGVLHSILASRRVKAAFELALGTRFVLYPLGYALVSVWTFWLVLAKEPDLPQQMWAVGGMAKMLLWAGQGAGVLLLAWAVLQVGGLRMLGLTQLWEFLRGRLAHGPDIRRDFRTTGAYGLVRHPMHAGGILILACQPTQSLGSLVFTLFGCVYMVLGTWLEERRLAAELGPAWRDYAARVPMLVPFFGIRRF